MAFFSIGQRPARDYYIVPVLLGVVVDVLVFFMPLRSFIFDLRSILPFIEPFCMVPFCMVPLCIRSVPVWLFMVPVPLPFCMVPVPLCMVPVPPVGVVWAKAVVLTQRAQTAAAKILMVFMMMWGENKE